MLVIGFKMYEIFDYPKTSNLGKSLQSTTI